MNETPRTRLTIPLHLSRDRGDRILMGLLSPMTAFLTGWGAWFFFVLALEERESRPQIVEHIVADLCFTFCSFAVLTFIWSVFTPVWLERLMEGGARKALVALGLLLLGLFAIFLSH